MKVHSLELLAFFLVFSLNFGIELTHYLAGQYVQLILAV